MDGETSANNVRRGSVKDSYIDVPATPESFGVRKFVYHRDDFSLFDYGVFPFQLHEKSKAMYEATRNFASILYRHQIPNHFTGFDPANMTITVKNARNLKYDDIESEGKPGFYLIPIESVWTDIATPVSSLHKDLRKGAANPEDYGLEPGYKPGANEIIRLPSTRVRFSSKIEAVDVYRGDEEQAKIAGLDSREAEQLKELTKLVAEKVRNDAETKGLYVADGKIEAAMGKRGEMFVADTCYTWDENRILVPVDGVFIDISKQFPRNIYTINGYRQKLEAAKNVMGKETWPRPPPLEAELIRLMGEMCRSVSFTIAGINHNERSISEIAKDAKEWLHVYKDRYQSDIPVFYEMIWE